MAIFAHGVGQGAELIPFLCVWIFVSMWALAGFIVGAALFRDKSLGNKRMGLVLMMFCLSIPFLSCFGLIQVLKFLSS